MSGRPTPAVAATLSFVLPGLGQITLGAVRRGVLLMLPVVAFVVVAIVVAGAGISTLVSLALSPEVLVALLVANLVFCIVHVIAIVDAKRTAAALEAPEAATSHRGTTAVLAVLIALTVALHGIIGAVGVQAYSAMGSVFGSPGSGEGWAIPDASFEPESTPEPTPSPSPSPTEASPTPTAAAPTAEPIGTPTPTKPPTWAKDGRLNVLLIGSDAGPGRWSQRTDTMIVLSIEVATGRAALFGIPRNVTGVPLADESKGAFWNGRYPGLLNSLYVYAMGHESQFPGGEARGFRAVTGAIQELVGVKLDGAVVVDLQGFVKLVDAIDGLWVDIPETVVDNAYPVPGGGRKIRIVIRAGCRQLDGAEALAYARTRHQDSDYGRMARQQRVLLAMAHQVDPFALIPKVPELLEIAGDHLWTTIDPDQIAGLAALASRVDPGSTDTVTFVPPRYPSHMTTASIRRIRAVVRDVFDDPPSEPGAGDDDEKDDCPS